jgi:hypothetical protein
MTLKAKLIIVGVAVGMVVAFVAHRYLRSTAQVLQHLTACAPVPVVSLTKVTGGFLGS